LWNGTLKKQPKPASKSVGDILLKRRYKVMIVDDNRRNVELLTEQFKQSGYETVSCFSGNEVIDMVSRERPDLILLDIMMPNLDGFQTCKILKEKEKERFLPIILISVKDDPESKIKGLSSGADDYMIKPYDFQELKVRILNLLKIVELDEEQTTLFKYYEKSVSTLKEVKLLMETLSYALKKVEKGRAPEGSDIEFAQKQISGILSRIDELEKGIR